MSSPIARADHTCCLRDLGSVNKPICKILRDKERIMGKGKKALKAEIDDTEALACSGKSILELLQDRLDEYIDELMDEEAVAQMKGKQLATLKGVADGLCQAIAIMQRPYLPDTDIVRDAAMERYEERNS